MFMFRGRTEEDGWVDETSDVSRGGWGGFNNCK